MYFKDWLTHFLFSFQQNLENLKAKSAAGKVEKKEVECGSGNLEYIVFSPSPGSSRFSVNSCLSFLCHAEVGCMVC